MIKKKILIILLVFQVTGCYLLKKNKTRYDIKVGEEFEIYIDENSCCKNCWLNDSSAKSIKLVGKKSIDLISNTEDGGTTHNAWIFQGVAEGSDTIKIVSITGGESCNNYQNYIFIIH